MIVVNIAQKPTHQPQTNDYNNTRIKCKTISGLPSLSSRG